MVEKSKTYTRIGDMHHSIALNLFVEQDNDVILYITKDGIPVDDASVEFCSYSGGGLSPTVRKSLLDLIKAIDEENRENPDSRM